MAQAARGTSIVQHCTWLTPCDLGRQNCTTHEYTHDVALLLEALHPGDWIYDKRPICVRYNLKFMLI